MQEDKRNKFEPKLVGFLCKWCTYQGADLAGTSRLKYEPNLVIVKVPCSARMSPLFLMKALTSGIDGILFSGCHPGDCHYTSGNMNARRRFVIFRKLLEFVGIEPERVQMSWCSASEDKKWATLVDSITEEVKKIGPNNKFQL